MAKGGTQIKALVMTSARAAGWVAAGYAVSEVGAVGLRTALPTMSGDRAYMSALRAGVGLVGAFVVGRYKKDKRAAALMAVGAMLSGVRDYGAEALAKVQSQIIDMVTPGGTLYGSPTPGGRLLGPGGGSPRQFGGFASEIPGGARRRFPGGEMGVDAPSFIDPRLIPRTEMIP